jgi:hypothetical protein
MNRHSLKTLVFLLAILLVLLACDLPGVPLPVATNPTADPGLIQTIVVATAGAAQTQTAMVLPPPSDTPTATLAPTFTPTESPTPTPTVIFIIPTRTYTPTATSLPTATSSFPTQEPGASCELVDQSPANGTVYDPRDRFNVEWTIQNTGDETWMASDIDFFFSDGRDMHEDDILDLPNNVRPGREITLRVPMRAPRNAGTYTSNWILGSRRNVLCRVSIRITVR